MKEGEPTRQKQEYFEVLEEGQNNGHRFRRVRTINTPVREYEPHYFELYQEEIRPEVWQTKSQEDRGPVKGQG